MKNHNLLLATDSYKLSHYKQYPPNTTQIFSYFESRGPIGKGFPEITFFGLQYYLKEYLEGKVVTKEKIDEAEQIAKLHFQNDNLFNRAGWEYILDKHDGHLPVMIEAVPEGSVIPRGNVLMTVRNTDPACYWLTNYLETLLVQCWYGSTIATQSREFKILILDYLKKTGSDLSLVDFKLHDFGFRGVSSVETAGIGGCAHLVNFKGTDTLAGILLARDYYNCEMAGFSIPAAEHSTITSWGRDNEKEAYENMLDQYPTGLVAVVSDSYDIGNACKNYWGKLLKPKVLSRNGVLVVRPDSGEPHVSVLNTLNMLGEAFGYEKNAKGFKVLNPKVRVIQGDGVDLESMKNIFQNMWIEKWSGDNIAFGSGGALLQKVNRDTCKFAFKCSAATVNGEERDVFKTPIGDSHKKSKKGRLKLIHNGVDYKTVTEQEQGDNLLRTVFANGHILTEYTLDQIRDLAFVDVS